MPRVGRIAGRTRRTRRTELTRRRVVDGRRRFARFARRPRLVVTGPAGWIAQLEPCRRDLVDALSIADFELSAGADDAAVDIAVELVPDEA